MTNRPRLKISHRSPVSRVVAKASPRDDGELIDMLGRPERRPKKTKAERRRIRRRHEQAGDGRS